jgi:hypothetical protein
MYEVDSGEHAMIHVDKVELHGSLRVLAWVSIKCLKDNAQVSGA